MARPFGTWHITHCFTRIFYLSDDATSFQARDFHVDKANFLPGDYQQYGGVVTTPGKALTRAQLLDYADHCLRKSDETF